MREATPKERAAFGRQARAQSPRSRHGGVGARVRPHRPAGDSGPAGHHPVPDLVPIRYGRMAVSPFAFFRGAAAVMAADLAHDDTSGLDVQLCGDAHLSNFGGFASPERDMIFDVNDFDETIPGPFEWDLKRLAASLEIAGRGREFDDAARTSMVAQATRSYRTAMREFAAMRDLDIWYSRLDAAAMAARWGAQAAASV